MSGDAQLAAERYLEALSAMDEEGFIVAHAPDAVTHDPLGALELTGADNHRRFFRGLCAAFDTLELVADRVFAGGGTAAVKWTGRGSGRNGREVTFEGIYVLEVDADGLITELWGYWDPARVRAELQAI